MASKNTYVISEVVGSSDVSISEGIQNGITTASGSLRNLSWFEVINMRAHVHIHLVPIESISDLDFAKADPNPKPNDLDAAANQIRESLRALGYGEVSE